MQPSRSCCECPQAGLSPGRGTRERDGMWLIGLQGTGEEQCVGLPRAPRGAVPHLQCLWWAGALGGLGGTCELLAPRAAAMWQWGRLWARFPVPTVFQMDTLGMCLQNVAIAWLGSVQGRVTPEPPLQPLQGLGGQKALPPPTAALVSVGTRSPGCSRTAERLCFPSWPRPARQPGPWPPADVHLSPQPS